MRTQWLKRAAAIFCAAHLTLLSAAEVPAQELAVKEFAAKTNTTAESMTQETESYADETNEITTYASDVLEQQIPEETQTEQETSAQLQESEQQTVEEIQTQEQTEAEEVQTEEQTEAEEIITTTEEETTASEETTVEDTTAEESTETAALETEEETGCDANADPATNKQNGLIHIKDYVWHYVKDGHIRADYTGLVLYDNNWYYVEKGILNWNYTGLTKYYDTWYYVKQGRLKWDYTGLTKYYDTWYYVEWGRLKWDYTGLTKYYDTWYYVEQGRLKWDYTGLTKYYDTWYYVEQGRLKWDYTGLTKYYDTWYYVEQGRLKWDYTGLTKYYDTWYYVEQGRLNWDYTGLTKYYDTWYYVEQGRLNWDYTGITAYEGMQYYVEGGIVDAKYFETITPWNGEINSLPNNAFYGPMAGSAARALEMQSKYGKYNCQVLGDTSRNVLYVMFVCGYDMLGLTDSILDTLQSRNVKAVFAVTGSFMQRNPRLIRRMIDEGHTIASHSWGHIEYPLISVEQQKNDMMTMRQEMINRYGYAMKYIVLPYESASERTLAAVGSCGYKTLGFNGYYADYDSRNQKPPQVAMDILNRIAFPGAVYCLHATSTTNAAILGSWIDHMRSIGYQFELFQR